MLLLHCYSQCFKDGIISNVITRDLLAVAQQNTVPSLLHNKQSTILKPIACQIASDVACTGLHVVGRERKMGGEFARVYIFLVCQSGSTSLPSSHPPRPVTHLARGRSADSAEQGWPNAEKGVAFVAKCLVCLLSLIHIHLCGPALSRDISADVRHSH